ncbi:MAG: ABC transporter permease [Actinomycetota bacterium]|nr:ABC transporter permease [Actinomycetota bacterium]
MSLRNAMAHRNLLYLLTLKELRTRYKKSALGWAWSLLNPLSQMVIFSIVFLKIFDAKAQTGDPSGLTNFPLYFLSGLVPWNFFAISIGTAIGNVQGGSGLIKKVAFPHEHLVLSVVAAQFVTLLIETGILAIALLIFSGPKVLLWLPLLLVAYLLWALLVTGVSLTLSAANVFFHDVNYLWGIVTQLLFYATPIIYFTATIPVALLRHTANWGPTGTFITAFHELMYDGRMPGLGRWVYMAMLAAVSLAFGAWFFHRLSPRFAEEM